MRKMRFGLLTCLSSAILAFALSSGSVFADEGAAGGGAATTPCNDQAPQCYSRTVGMTWVYVKFNQKYPQGKSISFTYSSGGVTIDPICGKVGGFYMLAPYFHKNGLSKLRNYLGPLRPLQDLYESGSIYIEQGGTTSQGGFPGVAQVLNGSSADTYEPGYGGPPILTSTAWPYRYLSPAGIAHLEKWGEPIDRVKKNFDDMPPELKRGYDWSQGSGLSWFCYDPDYGGDQFYSRSSVTVDGSEAISERDSTVTKTYSPSANATSTTVPVTFKHYIVAGTIPDKADGLNMSITVTETVTGGTASPGAGTIKTETFPVKPGPWVTAGNEVRNLRVTSNVNVTFVPSGSPVKVCQTIQYDPKYWKVQGGVGVADTSHNAEKPRWKSTACIVIQAPRIPDPVICDHPDWHWNENYGNSYGETGVVRARQSTPPYEARTRGGGSKEATPIYARPGDSIRFDHCLAVGSHSVTGSHNFGETRKPIVNDGNTTDVPRTKLDVTDFQIRALTTTSHAFKHRTIVQGSPLVELKKFTYSLGKGVGQSPIAKESQYNYRGVIDANIVVPNAFLVLSPSIDKTGNQSTLDTYKCQYGDFEAFTRGFYQIPGFDVSRCASSGQTVVSDVGTTIKQILDFKQVKAWVRESHSIPGTCGYQVAYCETSSYCGCYSHTNARCTQCHNYTVNQRFYINSFDDAYRSPNNIYGAVAETGSQTKKVQWPGCHPNGSRQSARDSGCSGPYPCGTYPNYFTGHSASGSSCTVQGTIWANKDNYWSRFWTEQQSSREQKIASVKVPYNFLTETKSNITNSSVTYLGETVSSNFVYSVKPRINQHVISESYATVTPTDTRVQFVEFVVSPEAPSDKVAGDIDARGSRENGVCEYYIRQFSGSMISCKPIENKDGPLNGEARYAGATYTAGYTRAVPDSDDIEVGSKYCVAVGVYHTDSFGNPRKPIISASDGDGLSVAYQQGSSLPNPKSATTSLNWNISGASCRTIAKKPNFQVWGEGIYTSRAKTSVSRKRVGIHLSKKTSDDSGITGPAEVDSASQRRIYGSWAEYEIIARYSTYGIASGAAIGYLPHSLTLPGGLRLDISNYCEFTIMTIGNSQCASNRAGNANISIDASSFVTPFKSRYYPKDAPHSGSVNSALGSKKRLDNAAFSNVDNDTNYVSFPGDASTGGSVIMNKGDGTLVIAAGGSLTIDGNICVGSGTCTNGTNDLMLGHRSGGNASKGSANSGRNTTSFHNDNTGLTDISTLPQVIIFANSVNITQNVTQVDAWIITNELNTCVDGDGSSAMCDKTLFINGPVVTNEIMLNRTAGANQGFGRQEASAWTVDQNLTNDGSMTPGEIFNYRPDAMFWAYNQAQRFSQATVTYSRELAPRL